MADLTTWILELMERLGYFGVVFLMFLENVFPPIPSELVMPAAGFASEKGTLNLYLVMAAGTLGSVLGALPLYYLGTIFDEKRLIELTEKYGKFVLVKPDDITKANKWFNKYGKAVIFFGRMIPAIRSLISIPAGMNRMPLLPFLLLTALGSAIWSSLLAYAGYALGANYDKVEQYIAPLSKAVVALMVVAILWFVIKRLSRSSNHSST